MWCREFESSWVWVWVEHLSVFEIIGMAGTQLWPVQLSAPCVMKLNQQLLIPGRYSSGASPSRSIQNVDPQVETNACRVRIEPGGGADENRRDPTAFLHTLKTIIYRTVIVMKAKVHTFYKLFRKTPVVLNQRACYP